VSPHRALAALKSATAIGYAVGAFAIAALTGLASVAHNTSGTHAAVLAHEKADVIRNTATTVRDSETLNELRAMHRDQVAAARKQTCILVAESTAERRACERRNYVEGP